jgi:hypothetical protein
MPLDRATVTSIATKLLIFFLKSQILLFDEPMALPNWLTNRQFVFCIECWRLT